jgi:hypothetical protein
MGAEYKNISFREIKEMKYDRESPQYVVLRGVPRAVEFHECGELHEEGHNYSTSFYLQDNRLFSLDRKNMVYVYNNNSKDWFQTSKEQLLRAASESNLEITVKGLFEEIDFISGKQPSIYWYEIVFNQHTIKRDFSETRRGN